MDALFFTASAFAVSVRQLCLIRGLVRRAWIGTVSHTLYNRTVYFLCTHASLCRAWSRERFQCARYRRAHRPNLVCAAHTGWVLQPERGNPGVVAAGLHRVPASKGEARPAWREYQCFNDIIYDYNFASVPYAADSPM